MRIKGLAKTIKDIRKMQESIESKINNNDMKFDISTNQAACSRDERLNGVWMELDAAADTLEGIAQI